MSRAYHAKKATPSDRTGPVSKSTLCAFAKSPWKWAHSPPTEPTAAMQLGSIVHGIALEDQRRGDDLEWIVSPYDSFRTKEAREWKEEKAEAGLMVLTEKEYLKAQAIALRARRAIKKALTDEIEWGFAEYDVEVEVGGSFNEVDLCGLIDVVPENPEILLDLKTCSSIGDERALSRVIFDRDYHMQGALYCDLYAHQHNLKESPGFGFVFIETVSPYETTYVKLSEAALALGRQRYIALVEMWKRLREVNIGDLPGAVQEGTIIEPPAWLAPV